MEVIFNEFNEVGVSRLGVCNLPGRLIRTDFGHLCTKPVACVGPVDARWKVFLGRALPPSASLFYPLSFLSCTPDGSLGFGRGYHLGGRVSNRETCTLRDRDERDDFQRKKQFCSLFAGSSRRHMSPAYNVVGTPMLSQKVSEIGRASCRERV